MYEITAPLSKADYKHYYLCRWELLRKPWDQSLGTEKDDIENVSVHRMAVSDRYVIAVGRLHFLNNTTAQIRYMAVRKEHEKQGIGTAIYIALEKEAYKNGIKLITLNARIHAIGFYKKLGITIIKKTNLLFNQIQHYEMQKHL